MAQPMVLRSVNTDTDLALARLTLMYIYICIYIWVYDYIYTHVRPPCFEGTQRVRACAFLLGIRRVHHYTD